MITPNEIAQKTMSAEKKASARNDCFAFYIGRPLSYVLTIPFLYINISPNVISLISIIPIIIGFAFMYIGVNIDVLLIGWWMFFLWNLLDGVDGNVARYKKEFSSIGSVYDAMSGYIAMILTFFGMGIAASHHPGFVQDFIDIPIDLYIIIGALSGIMVIFPRFIMHKMITTVGIEKMELIKDKSKYNFCKIVALNLTSVSGFVQVFMLVAILINMMDLFTIIYFIINASICFISLHTMLSEKA